MPRDIKAIMRTGVKRKEFVEKTKAKPVKKKPKKKVKDKKRYFGSKNVRLTVRESAIKRKQLYIIYIKTTTKERKTYTVAPYSYRYKKLKVGWRKMLFAYDMKEKHIKGFALKNIQGAEILNKTYAPRWKIEIG